MQKYNQQEIPAIKISNESHLHWKKEFQQNLLYCRTYAHFEASNEIVKFSIEIKATNIYKKNPVCNGYYIVSELNDILQNGY